MTVDRREKIIRVILTTTLEDGSFPEAISREIEKLGIDPNDIFEAYLKDQNAKEPTYFLTKNADKLKIDDDVLELLVNRIRKNPEISKKIREIFYRKDKNFYTRVTEKMIHLFTEQVITEQEENNLLYFLEENTIKF